MKKALLLNASHNELGLIMALRKLGYWIIATGSNLEARGNKWVDCHIPIDYSDKEKVMELAIEHKIDAIIPNCNDFGVLTASYVAEKLKLPGHDTYENAVILHNKDKFKELAAKLGLDTPRSVMFDDEAKALKYARGMKPPLIVKPVDACGGRGCGRIMEAGQAQELIREAFNNSRKKCVVVEEFVQGTQHGFCAFIRNCKVAAVCSNDELSIHNPYRVEIDIFPASNFEQVKDSLIRQIEAVCREMKLKDGIFHLQYIMDGERPMIIEVMRRVPGNMYLKLGNALTLTDWEYWQARAQCGLAMDGFPEKTEQEGCFAYKKVMAKENGTIAGFEIPELYDRYAFDSIMLRRPGYEITDHMTDEIGFLFLSFPSKATATKILLDEYRDDLVKVDKANGGAQ